MADSGGIAADRLRSFVERIERLVEDRNSITADIREVRAEAKAAGFDGRALAAVIARRALDPAERNERDLLLELYERALDGLPDTLARAAPGLGTPAAPTADERAAGVVAAFVDDAGTRCSIAVGGGGGRRAPPGDDGAAADAGATP